MRTMRLLAAVSIAAAIPIAAACGSPQARERDASMEAAASSDAAWSLRQDMRKLWTDHVVWTRNYIIAALGNQPDAESAANRLMKNQEDLGDAIRKYYGPDAGRQLTTLLKEHISIAVEIVKSAKSGDKNGQQQADDRWKHNATAIADFLSKANPNWPRATLVDMMDKHLATTADELAARVKQDWSADIEAFDKVYDHILNMSDALAEGIVKQFPEQFAGK